MRPTTASTGKSIGNVCEEPDGWAHSQGDRKAQSASTHLDAPGLQLLFYSAQVQGDGCTGIVNPEDCQDLAISQLCKQIRGSWTKQEHLWKSSELKASHLLMMRNTVAVPQA